MTLPTFVGIAGLRCGSTWLHQLLQSHPRIYMPTKRKEIDFVSLHFDKGLDWYESFFPDPDQAHYYQAIGEISPRYLHFPEAASRLASLGSVQVLLAILRNPVDRAYSMYGQALRLQGYTRSFEEYLDDYPQVLQHGFYARHLNSFLNYWHRDQLCCLIFEEAVKDPRQTQHTLATVLHVDPQGFPPIAGSSPVNATFLPRFKGLAKLSSQMRTRLLRADLDWVVNWMKKAGIQHLLNAKGSSVIPPMSPETRGRLRDLYHEDRQQLGILLNRDLNLWESLGEQGKDRDPSELDR